MTTDIRKAAQDALDTWDYRKKLGMEDVAEEMEALRAAMQQPDDAKQRLLEIMRKNGLATGHGDTLKQVIDTLEVELTDMLAKARQDAARYRWVRDHASRDWLDWGITDHDVDAAMQGDNNGTL